MKVREGIWKFTKDDKKLLHYSVLLHPELIGRAWLAVWGRGRGVADDWAGTKVGAPGGRLTCVAGVEQSPWASPMLAPSWPHTSPMIAQY